MGDEYAAPPRVSVLMPVHNGAAFVRRALDSLWAQTFTEWELVIVDDGSTDETAAALVPYTDDPRVSLVRFAENRGLGAALNAAMDTARADLIAYLPADDVYYPEHLASLVALLVEHDAEPGMILAHSGVRYHYNRYADAAPPGEPLQLVQVLHCRVPDCWTERAELTTDDLDRMYWAKLRARGMFVGTEHVTCEWVDHPAQRHKIIRENPTGGLNTYRSHYGVRTPLIFRSSMGNFIDEATQFRAMRERPDTTAASDGLKVLLVGELAYNADRVLALEERGHTLYGLWMPDPMWFNAVGPHPFGHVTDIAYAHWRETVRRVQPDVIYALLNWQTVAFAHQILTENPGIPFVWHFKEGPFICLEKNLWPALVDLTTRADGVIFSSPEMRDWFDTAIPGATASTPTFILDGDLPKRDWFVGERSPRLSASDGEVHTVVPGRPIGLHAEYVGELGAAGIHLHFYGDFTQTQWASWITRVNAMAPGKLHLHPNVDQRGWLAEFSQYDAGWLHYFPSENAGEVRRANWDDLNYPARIATLAVAGIPLLQYDNADAFVATDRLARARDLGFFGRSMAEIAAQLHDRSRLDAVRDSVWRQRDQFTFDAHADALIAFFRQVIASRA